MLLYSLHISRETQMVYWDIPEIFLCLLHNHFYYLNLRLIPCTNNMLSYVQHMEELKVNAQIRARERQNKKMSEVKTPSVTTTGMN